MMARTRTVRLDRRRTEARAELELHYEHRQYYAGPRRGRKYGIARHQMLRRDNHATERRVRRGDGVRGQYRR